MEDLDNIIQDLLNNGLPEPSANIHTMKERGTLIDVLYDCDILKYGNAIFYLN